jgi:CheY-like chemotaxis protein
MPGSFVDATRSSEAPVDLEKVETNCDARSNQGVSTHPIFLVRSNPRDYVAAVEHHRRSLENIRILIVDDKADFRLVTAHFLFRYGAQVFAAKNAFEGLQLVREIRPDLVLSDINMPGRSGLQFLADIRNREKDRGKIPVIAMTAYVLDQAVVDAGFESVLRKPFAPGQLLAVIDSVLQN